MNTFGAATLDDICRKVDERLAEIQRVPSPPPHIYALVPHVYGCRWPVVLRELHRKVHACLDNDIATLRYGAGGFTSNETYAALQRAIDAGEADMDAVDG